MYGPGGSYAHFAGVDAARAYVSGCFQEDLTHDLRGLEEMFIVGRGRTEYDAELAEMRALMEAEEKPGRVRWLRGRREKRRKEAWEKVRKTIDHWDRFYREHDRYFYVGKVLHESLDRVPVRKLCQTGKKQRE